MAQDVINASRSNDVFLMNTGNATTTTVTEPAPTTTEPSGSGVFPLGKGGTHCAERVKVQFFGVGNDSTTFSAKLYGWELQKSRVGNLPQWVPTPLATFTGIQLLAALPGLAGCDVDNTMFYANSITLGLGTVGQGLVVVSPGASVAEIAHAIVPTYGAKLLEIRYATGSSATSCNALVKPL